MDYKAIGKKIISLVGGTENINYFRFVIHMQFFLQRLLEDLLQKEITEEERVYLIVHISRTTQKQ